MSLKSTTTRYGRMAIALHWTSAAAIVLAFAAGLVAANAPSAGAAPILLAHISLGSLVLLLTLLRLGWWIFADRRPALPMDQPRWQRTIAHIVHGSLYLAILVMGASGTGTLTFSGVVPHLLAGDPVPDLSTLPPRITHGLVSRLMLALLALHIGAALYHQFVRRDHLLARMGIGAANERPGVAARP
jgi:cytochrome b561